MATCDILKEELFEKVCCRQAQANYLLQLFGPKRSSFTYPSIFIYGHSGVGKSFTVSTILSHLSRIYAIVDCVECYTSKLLFELLLDTISKQFEATDFDCMKCDNVNDFVRHLKQILEDHQCDESVYIVLDNAEYLRDVDSNLLSVFLRLQELIQKKVCVILISKIVWEKFRIVPGFFEPIQLHFPQYSKDEVHTILLNDHPEDYSSEFYHTYLQMMLNVFYTVCCNLVELRYLVKQIFPKYVEPIVNGVIPEHNFQKLFRNVEPHLKQALRGVYLRESLSPIVDSQQLDTRKQLEPNIQLPFYSKYLLIASYLASYNPSHTDKRFFLKRHDKIGKRAKLNSMKRNERVSTHLLGPKTFPLHRLLAIFNSIVDETVFSSAHIYSQISTLVSLNLLTDVGKSDLDSAKYKCNVSLDFISSIARSVNFEVVKYLYDFI